MKCVIPGINLKYIARAIYMLMKIGEEMCIVPEEDRLCFRALNGCNSAYGDVTFLESFFSYYAHEDVENLDTLRCKISIRSAMMVFKTPSLLEKQVESCLIQLDANDEKVLFVMKFKNGIIKTHFLPVLDTETEKANYKKDGFANHLRIQPRVMSDVIQNFQQNLIEITLEVLEDKALIRNYVDENSNICNETRTQLKFGIGEFDEYIVQSDVVITFCLKEFRAIMSLAEAIAQPIDIHFDRPGKPAVFICQNNNIETNLVLATLNPECSTGSQSTTSTRANAVPKKTTAKRAPVKKRRVNSFDKTSVDNGKRTNSTSFTEIDSPDRISNVSESPSQNKRDSCNFSRTTCTPRTSALNNSEGTTAGNSVKSNPFSSFLKRKSEQEISNPLINCDEEDDLVENSPPRHQSKKAKLIFQKCFQTTFDPRTLPGYSEVEVDDSGEESN